ncbi:hypothetical protein EZV73_12250 [Acidaminobacter sp. JC074]|uniref:hypothetical protein n=1 Tax=Acidaminobacter sp. JC074 TaxID=2530199 RepID=UPI001F10DF61|nr:hypothetical protein [Acidaminobacter sp. JC074]MCH4888353.1 hypothetical protein [Acidaminobacter sp. JC074]
MIKDDIAISTAAFCLWDIGPVRKLKICEDLGFTRIVIAFSTMKMLKQFARSPDLCKKLSHFDHVMIHAPWCGITYKDNKMTKEVFKNLEKIGTMACVEAVIFHFDCISDWSCFKNLTMAYYVKNPNHAKWENFNQAIIDHDLKSVLDINKAIRFENYIDYYLSDYSKEVKAIHVSGFVDDLGRMPIVESGQIEVLEKVKSIKAPIVIEGLFSPGDFQGIRDEIKVIQESMAG